MSPGHCLTFYLSALSVVRSGKKKGIKEMEKLPFLCLIPYDLTDNFAEKRHKN